MLIRRSAGCFKGKIRIFCHFTMSMDMVEMAMEIVNEVASVWVFLDGIASCRLDTICILIRTIDLQKGVLKYSYLKE